MLDNRTWTGSVFSPPLQATSACHIHGEEDYEPTHNECYVLLSTITHNANRQLERSVGLKRAQLSKALAQQEAQEPKTSGEQRGRCGGVEM